MSSLLFEINEQADIAVAESVIVATNVDYLAEYLEMSTGQLNEAISTWLAKVRNTVATGKLNPDKKDSVVKILGALSALSNPDLAAALDEKGDLGTILITMAGDQDKVKSNAGLQRLLMIGNHPSVKAFITNAQKAMQQVDVMGNTQPIELLTKKIQSQLEPIMNKKLAAERKVK
jgi:hypothetical protein